MISWGLDQGFTAEFDWVGTRDPSPYLAAPEGIAFMRELGVDAVRGYNHALAWEAARLLTERWGTELRARASRWWARWPRCRCPSASGSTREDAARLRDALLFEDGIEVQLHAGAGDCGCAISAQVYNEMADIERLAGGRVSKSLSRGSPLLLVDAIVDMYTLRLCHRPSIPRWRSRERRSRSPIGSEWRSKRDGWRRERP